MENDEWYKTCDFLESEDGRGYHLTDKAPQEAIDSYEEFYGTKYVEIDGDSYSVE